MRRDLVLPNDQNPGRIYFIEAKDSAIKIGFVSDDISQRMRKLQEGTHLELNLLGFIPGDEKTEILVQELFKQYKIRGEWFSLEIKSMVEIFIKLLGIPKAVDDLQKRRARKKAYKI